MHAGAVTGVVLLVLSVLTLLMVLMFAYKPALQAT
jgi:hypothetical protein